MKKEVQQLSREDQERNLAERAFMLTIKVQPSARPKISYRITCFECEEEYFLHVNGKTALSDARLQQYLVANGWLVGTRGYHCPECMDDWIEAVTPVLEAVESIPPFANGSKRDYARYLHKWYPTLSEETIAERSKLTVTQTHDACKKTIALFNREGE